MSYFFEVKCDKMSFAECFSVIFCLFYSGMNIASWRMGNIALNIYNLSFAYE